MALRIKEKRLQTTFDQAVHAVDSTNGDVVEEHPVAMIMTNRSTRLIDAVSGRTKLKFVTSTILALQTVEVPYYLDPTGDESCIAIVVGNPKSNRTVCHLIRASRGQSEKVCVGCTCSPAPRRVGHHSRNTVPPMHRWRVSCKSWWTLRRARMLRLSHEAHLCPFLMPREMPPRKNYSSGKSAVVRIRLRRPDFIESWFVATRYNAS